MNIWECQKDWTVDRIKSQIEMLTNLLKEKESKSIEKAGLRKPE